MTIKTVAKEYYEAGLWVVPLMSPKAHHTAAGKAPLVKEWQTKRCDWETLESHIDQGCNIGVVTGRVSGLICVDIDPKNGGFAWYQANDESLGYYLRERTGSGGWHLYFKYPAEMTRVPSLAAGTIAPGVDFLADDGRQCVTWPSVHVSGGEYRIDNNLTLLDVAPEMDEPPLWLLQLILERFEAREKPTEVRKGTEGVCDHPGDIEHATDFLQNTQPSIAGQGGDSRLYFACCRMHEFGLSNSVALGLLRDHFNPRCSPPWSDRELKQKLKNAARYAKEAFGKSSVTVEFEVEERQDVTAAGEETAQPSLYDKKLPMHNATVFIKRMGNKLLFCEEQGLMYNEDAKRWELLNQSTLRNLILQDIKKVSPLLYPNIKPQMLNDIAILICISLQSTMPEIVSDKWLNGRKGNYVSVGNGIVNIETGTVEPHSKDWFSFTTLEFAYDPAATAPMFQEFLKSVWSDEETIEALQLWIGYLLISQLKHQKFALFIGESRSGKGTLATVISNLLGEANCASCTLTQLAGDFGLSPLIGKRAIFFHDAHKAHGSLGDLATERLISIVGNDPQSINRKNREILTMRLPVKITMVCNQIPSFINTRGALTNRMLVFPFTESFKGREDLELSEKLRSELPGIFNWAMKGAQQVLNGVAPFQSKRGQESLTEITQLLEPISGFLSDDASSESEGEPKFDWMDSGEVFTTTEELYRAYVVWCSEHGHSPKSQTKFAMEVKTWLPKGVYPSVRRHNGILKRGYVGLRLNRKTPEFN